MTLAKKLSRLPPLSRPQADPAASSGALQQAPVAARAAVSPWREPDAGRPSLDSLRDRIAAILARGGQSPSAARYVADPSRPDAGADRTAGDRTAQDGTVAERIRTSDSPGFSFDELPFSRLETPHGELDLFRKRLPPGYRVGSSPVWAAERANCGLLALLALDPTLSECDPRRALYLDTETTGLSGGTGTVAFLVGLSFFDESQGGFVLEQVMMRDLFEEAPLLEHVAQRIADCSFVVSFNGKSFDLPLLATRTVMARTRRLPKRPHLDLLHVARRLHKHRLPSCSLQTLEAELLGQKRVGDVSGADIAAIYHHYLRSKDASGLMPIVEHNALDVASMLSLVGLYGEPLESWESGGGVLSPSDVAAASSVARRGGDLDCAERLASASVRLGAPAFGHRARGDIARARGDKARALLAYEAALESAVVAAPPSGPDGALRPIEIDRLRLELAKLYEHHARAYQKAINLLADDPSESLETPTRHLARLARLGKKLAKEDALAPTAAERAHRPPRESSKRAAKAR